MGYVVKKDPGLCNSRLNLKQIATYPLQTYSKCRPTSTKEVEQPFFQGEVRWQVDFLKYDTMEFKDQ